jgi:hypothetical protein
MLSVLTCPLNLENRIYNELNASVSITIELHFFVLFFPMD